MRLYFSLESIVYTEMDRNNIEMGNLWNGKRSKAVLLKLNPSLQKEI